MIDVFDKGESVPRTIQCLDDDLDALDTANFLTIEIRVFNTLLRPIGTYTLAAGEISRLSPTTGGLVFFVVPATTTATIRALKYYYRIKTTENDANYPTGVRTRYFTGWCFELRTTK